MPTVHRNAIPRSVSFLLADVRKLNEQGAPNPGVDGPSVGRKATGADALRMVRLDCVNCRHSQRSQTDRECE